MQIIGNGDQQPYEKKQLISIVLSALILIMLNFTSLGRSVNNFIHVLAFPVVWVTQRGTENISVFARSVFTQQLVYKRLVDAEKSLYECKADHAEIELLKEENASMRLQLELKDEGFNTLEAKSFFSDVTNSVDLLSLNKGTRDGVKDGDFVVYGNSFVGKIVKTFADYSYARLPIDKRSLLEVFIMRKVGSENYKMLGKGLAVGDGNVIHLENYVGSESLQVGDYVFVDSVISDKYFVMGYISSVTNDPASPNKDAIVQPSIDIGLYRSFIIILNSIE
jgi:cell shape-determining protein MreC